LCAHHNLPDYAAAQREPVQRQVAVKLIKAGMGTSDVLARFEAERQALAPMNHINVAAVYDAGATQIGRPYFAMEYMPGFEITAHCDARELDFRQRIELFLQVCDGPAGQFCRHPPV
jgi:eukaryotic-like serine/threonine-protein kinase